MIAALKGERNAIAERPQQVSRPWPHRDHDVPCADLTIRRQYAPPIAVLQDRADLILADRSSRASKHPGIGFYDGSGRIHRRRLSVQQSGGVDGHDVRFERRDVLPVQYFALDAIVGEKRLLGLRRNAGVTAPGFQPSGFAEAPRCICSYDPLPVQLERGADETAQRKRARSGVRG